MFEVYNFNRKSNDDIYNTIMDSVAEAAKTSYEGKSYADSVEKKKILNQSIVKYSLTGTKFESEYEKVGLEAFKNPRITKNKEVRENFDTVLAGIVSAVNPAVSSSTYQNLFAEIVNVGWGQTAKFNIKSNGLFKVNEIAEGINRGVLQPIYNDEFSVNAGKVEIATSIDWYSIATGMLDWGDFAIKIARSFDGYIFLKIVATMVSASTSIVPAYTATGIDTINWTNVCSRVSAANGGVPVYGLGTLAALNQVYPSVVGLQYGLGEQIAKEGFLDKYLGVHLIPIDQVIVPGTTNSTAPFAIPSDIIFITAAAGDRPVKVVFEGDSVVIETIPTENPDRTYGFSVQMKIGVAALVGSKFGIITL